MARPTLAGPDSSYSIFNNIDPTTATATATSTGTTTTTTNPNANPNLTTNNSTTTANMKSTEYFDWNDETSVASIIEDLHVQLESTLRCSIVDYNSNNNTNTNINATAGTTTSASYTNQTKPRRFIKRITIVKGRGFYTYCIGSAAPFLKIEYYNPSDRWRVKAMLERGLELPLCYHPISTSENRSMCNNNGNGQQMELLKFRCYEAHIPYTMQVFKV